MHDILQAVRDVNNRNCSECCEQIGGTSSAFAVLDCHVWVCNECANAFMESGLLTDSKSLKTCAEEWTTEEMSKMIKPYSNKMTNLIYERHVSGPWKKPHERTSRHERIHWILAKYKGKLFVFSEKNENNSNKSVSESGSSVNLSSAESLAQSTELPPRLMDYFVVVSMGDQVITVEDNENDGDRSPVPSMLEEMEFTPVVSSCFPDPKYVRDTPLPDHLGK